MYDFDAMIEDIADMQDMEDFTANVSYDLMAYMTDREDTDRFNIEKFSYNASEFVKMMSRVKIFREEGLFYDAIKICNFNPSESRDLSGEYCAIFQLERSFLGVIPSSRKNFWYYGFAVLEKLLHVKAGNETIGRAYMRGQGTGEGPRDTEWDSRNAKNFDRIFNDHEIDILGEILQYL